MQQALANAVLKHPAATFGHQHLFEVGALSLGDVAAHYVAARAAEYEVEVKHEYDPKSKVETTEMRLQVPEDIGNFCSFESFSANGVKNLRFKGQRKSDCDVIAVGELMLRYYNNKRVKGCVTFEVEAKTVWINGATGIGTGPHEVNGFLKKTNNLNSVVTYARANLPTSHPLYRP